MFTEYKIKGMKDRFLLQDTEKMLKFAWHTPGFLIRCCLQKVLTLHSAKTIQKSASPHCASKRKKENHKFQKMIPQITHSYPNMTISYQFCLHIRILVEIW